MINMKPEFKTIIVNLDTGKTVSTFDNHIPILPYDKTQRQILIDTITDSKQKAKANLSSYWLPYGMTF